MKKLEEMTAKELKVLADKAGIEYKKNASKATMISLMEAYNEGAEDQKGNEVTVEEIAEVLDTAVEEIEEVREKVYCGICVKTGKPLYL